VCASIGVDRVFRQATKLASGHPLMQAGPLAKISRGLSVASQIVIEAKIGVFQHNRSRAVER